MQPSFKLAFAFALVAATVAYASAARQLEQIDSKLVADGSQGRRGLTQSRPAVPEAGLLEAGINIGSEVFVPSVSFLDVGSVLSGLLQGPSEYSGRGAGGWRTDPKQLGPLAGSSTRASSPSTRPSAPSRASPRECTRLED